MLTAFASASCVVQMDPYWCRFYHAIFMPVLLVDKWRTVCWSEMAAPAGWCWALDFVTGLV